MPGVGEPVSSMCCRHGVRHDDELCCECGVVHRNEYGSASLVDVLLVSGAAIVVVAVLAVCTYLGVTADDGTKLLVGISLGLAALVVLRWAITHEHDDVEPAPWMRPGTFSNNEPKEQ